jgi:hypothetical protein
LDYLLGQGSAPPFSEQLEDYVVPLEGSSLEDFDDLLISPSQFNLAHFISEKQAAAGGNFLNDEKKKKRNQKKKRKRKEKKLLAGLGAALSGGADISDAKQQVI